MRLLTGIVSAAAVMGLVMSASAAEGSKKDKTEVKLKPNQVLVSVPGMTWPVGWPAKVRSALKTLQFVEQDKPIEADVKKQQVIFSVTDKKKFDEKKLKAALKAKGYPKAKVLAGPK